MFDMMGAQGGQGQGQPGQPGQAPGQPSPQSPDQVRSQAEQAMGMIRELAQQVEKIGRALPPLQAEVGQFRQILKRMVIKAGQLAPASSPSADQLPTGQG